ncbi:hypothetical protein LINGRAHAP2_LOCUS16799, partial [Linum grandiflorum]
MNVTLSVALFFGRFVLICFQRVSRGWLVGFNRKEDLHGVMTMIMIPAKMTITTTFSTPERPPIFAGYIFSSNFKTKSYRTDMLNRIPVNKPLRYNQVCPSGRAMCLLSSDLEVSRSNPSHLTNRHQCF